MYNRYIPQADGTHMRSRVPEPLPRHTPHPTPEVSPPPQTAPQDDCGKCPVPCSDKANTPQSCPQKPTRPHHAGRKQPVCPPKEPSGTSVGSFLRNILPGDFDTADLLIVLLLLLMAGDCKEDQNTALLTLALYLFL